MTYIPTTQVAAHLRKQLRSTFPGVKFSVRSGPSTWIDVTWVDGPDEADVKKLTAPLRGSHWDKYTQGYIRTEPVTVEFNGGTITGDPLVEGIHLRREYSEATLAKATALWLTHHDRTDIEAARPKWQDPMYLAGQDIRSGPVDAQLREISAKVILAEQARAYAARLAERPAIDVENTERGTKVLSPKGKEYTVVDFDTSDDVSYLRILADDSKRRERLDQQRANEQHWTLAPTPLG
jgi:hypothetical protein